MQTFRIAMLCALALSLLACGFHLRDTAALPTALQPLYIGGKQSNGPLAQALRVELRNSDTQVSYNPATANYRLLLLHEDQDQRTVSLDRRGLVAEYGLITAVQFELRNQAGERVLGPQTVELRRTVVNNPDNVTTTGEEIRIVREDMLKSLASQIVRRLAAYANKQANAAPAAAAPTSDAPVPAPAEPQSN
jgi:LPS-assembly lipoprotein